MNWPRNNILFVKNMTATTSSKENHVSKFKKVAKARTTLFRLPGLVCISAGMKYLSDIIKAEVFVKSTSTFPSVVGKNASKQYLIWPNWGRTLGCHQFSLLIIWNDSVYISAVFVNLSSQLPFFISWHNILRCWSIKISRCWSIKILRCWSINIFRFWLIKILMLINQNIISRCYVN